MKTFKEKKTVAYVRHFVIPFMDGCWEINTSDKLIYYIYPISGGECTALQLYTSLNHLFCSTQLIHPMVKLTNFLFKLENGWTIDEFSATKIHEGTIIDGHNNNYICGGTTATPVSKDKEYVDIWK